MTVRVLSNNIRDAPSFTQIRSGPDMVWSRILVPKSADSNSPTWKKFSGMSDSIYLCILLETFLVILSMMMICQSIVLVKLFNRWRFLSFFFDSIRLNLTINGRVKRFSFLSQSHVVILYLGIMEIMFIQYHSILFRSSSRIAVVMPINDQDTKMSENIFIRPSM